MKSDMALDGAKSGAQSGAATVPRTSSCRLVRFRSRDQPMGSVTTGHRRKTANSLLACCSACRGVLFFMRPACAGAEEAQPAAGSSARAEEDAAFGEASVGYVFSEKKRGSLLTPEFIDRARCGGARAARGVGAAWPAFSRGSSVGSDSRPASSPARAGCASCPWTPSERCTSRCGCSGGHAACARRRRCQWQVSLCFSGADAGLRGAACAGWPPV